MELIAVHSLRYTWNAIWYSRGDCSVSVKNLRPGAHCNPNCEFPKVRINCELKPSVILAETSEGNMSCKRLTGTDGNGTRVNIEENTVHLMRPGESGNDFCAVFNPVVWLNQTKSREMVTMNGKTSLSKITQQKLHGDKGSILEKQMESAEAFKLDQPNVSGFSPTFVFDIFSNRLTGDELDVFKPPNNLLLMTDDNFGTVVGPMYKRALEVIKSEIPS